MLAVTGLGVAFAWFVLTLFAAPAHAHADDGDGLLDTLTETMRDQFSIEHSTFQFEERTHLDHEGALHRDLADLVATATHDREESPGHPH